MQQNVASSMNIIKLEIYIIFKLLMKLKFDDFSTLRLHFHHRIIGSRAYGFKSEHYLIKTIILDIIAIIIRSPIT